jgi:uncharacterized protein (TIGR00725 family)
MRPRQVAVCGPRECTEAERVAAHEVGRLLAEAGATVLCGGGTGVMAAAAAGARAADGLVIGIRPGASADDADPHLSAVVVTNMGEARNAVLVWSADAVIVVGGSWGTLSELALAKRRGGIPVVGLGGWQVLGPDPADTVPAAATPAEAVAIALGPA